ncbi:hypothetical protein BRC73_08280 [Halobacteriales archaeon QH_7_66_37]|nr:MAG: hypothetical protein BRC73_08280 [Halobacteriales archaeon QH_7_66_37]
MALLFGIQLIMFGVLSDLIVTANRRQGRRIDSIDERLEAIETTSVGGTITPRGRDGAVERGGDARETQSADSGDEEPTVDETGKPTVDGGTDSSESDGAS